MHLIPVSRTLPALLCTLFAVHAVTAADPKAPSPAAAAPEARAPTAGPELKDPVATVDGEKISRADLQEAFEAAVGRMGADPATLEPEMKLQGYHAVLQDLLLDRILRKKSAQIAVEEKEIDAKLDEIRKQLGSEERFAEELKNAGRTLDQVKGDIRTAMRQERWVKDQLAGKDTLKDEEIKAFFEKNAQAFQVPEMVRASHILIRTAPDANDVQLAEKEKQIQTIAERIKKGEDFAKVAKETSEDPGSKESGGDLDFFSRDRMVPEFAKAAFELKTGQVSAPVKTQFGYHLIKVTDHKDARSVPFEEAKGRISEHLKQQKQRDAMSDLFKSLQAGAKVENFLPPLPSPPPEAPAPKAP